MSKRDDFCAKAQEQEDNGSIYVLGAQGETGGQITEAWIKKREHNKASNIKRVLALWKKRLAEGFAKLRAFDCSGLVLWCLAQCGLYNGSDKKANGIYYDLCTPISKGELLPGDLTFKKYATNSRMYHVGIYRGGGKVTHSKGRDIGVVTESISKDGWNRYGRLKLMADDVPGSGGVFALTRVLKYGCKGDDVKWVQARLKELRYFKGAIGGNFLDLTKAATIAFQKVAFPGEKKEWDGKVGKNTIAKLGGTWYVR